MVGHVATLMEDIEREDEDNNGIFTMCEGGKQAPAGTSSSAVGTEVGNLLQDTFHVLFPHSQLLLHVAYVMEDNIRRYIRILCPL